MLSGAVAAEDVIMPPADFLAEAFDGDPPSPSVLWITPEMREEIGGILQHNAFRALRVRYWRRGERTAWILEEIGKYKPITTGLVVSGDSLERIRVLVYRESHGWEVKHDFFTDQFRGLTLDHDRRLSAQVDGISGATLSVNALVNLARLALYLDERSDATR